MIARVWHGWTKPKDADAYHQLLRTKILPGIHRVKGYKGAQLLRREVPGLDPGEPIEVEFITITMWESWDAIREFAGPEGTHAVIAPDARALLSRCDEASVHYDAEWCE